jgi:hypothetical protein
MRFVPADPQFEQRARASFAKQGALVDQVVPGRVGISLPFRPELGVQMLIALAGRGGVKD